MFDSIIEFIRSAITEQIIEDPVWATIALIGQVVFGGIIWVYEDTFM